MNSDYSFGKLRIFVAAISLAGCTTIDPSPATTAALDAHPVADGWQSNEVAINKVSASGTPYAYRTGSTPSGSFYSLYGDGTGTVSRFSGPLTKDDWSIDCSVDKMNDKRECVVRAKRTPILIYYAYSATPQEVCVSGHDFPGRTAMIRVGSSKPITTNQEGCVAASRVLPALKSADKVATRKVHWPYDTYNDESGDLVGLNDALGLADYIRSRLK